ncbi:MAG: FAD-dependent oxidoreductase [Candidatus Eisenbacteria bacterium]|uniref:FAD-dependent oxidoreductase n=1 Tax=Eiseniibacteriota bacterium TaxID=2212470 RepID=A0A538TDE5_UNCEI|nr:MAG: FAD-dependent oxidoreductase [Candidatus Eisenbacteria bacterium]
MLLGLLLARAGVQVVVLEKHADFLRDFRGDTVHPSTLEIMHQLGLLESFLKLPHRRMHELRVRMGNTEVPVADFSHLPTKCRFLALMPQWDFLNFIATEARRYPTFALRMRTEATGLIEEAGTFVGVRAQGPDGPIEVRASLVVGANGRQSELREEAGLEIESLGAPMDVMWFRLSRLPDDRPQAMGTFDRGRILILLDRGEHWQVGYVIAKGSLEQIRGAGLDAFREAIAQLEPFARERLREIQSWEDVKLLTVRIDRLRQWYRPGLLFIGDAAHAMSPVGGVGINLAVQDAVAAANVVAEPIRQGRLTTGHLRRVQRRRELPTRMTQRLQILMQELIVRPTLGLRFERVRTPAVEGIRAEEERVPVAVE